MMDVCLVHLLQFTYTEGEVCSLRVHCLLCGCPFMLEFEASGTLRMEYVQKGNTIVGNYSPEPRQVMYAQATSNAPPHPHV